MAIFINFSPASNHLHPLQVENCDSNSRLVVDEDDNGKFILKGLNMLKNPTYQLLNLSMLMIKHDINQPDFKIVNLHFVKSE